MHSKGIHGATASWASNSLVLKGSQGSHYRVATHTPVEYTTANRQPANFHQCAGPPADQIHPCHVSPWLARGWLARYNVSSGHMFPMVKLLSSQPKEFGPLRALAGTVMARRRPPLSVGADPATSQGALQIDIRKRVSGLFGICKVVQRAPLEVGSDYAYSRREIISRECTAIPRALSSYFETLQRQLFTRSQFQTTWTPPAAPGRATTKT